MVEIKNILNRHFTITFGNELKQFELSIYIYSDKIDIELSKIVKIIENNIRNTSNIYIYKGTILRSDYCKLDYAITTAIFRNVDYIDKYFDQYDRRYIQDILSYFNKYINDSLNTELKDKEGN